MHLSRVWSVSIAAYGLRFKVEGLVVCKHYIAGQKRLILENTMEGQYFSPGGGGGLVAILGYS